MTLPSSDNLKARLPKKDSSQDQRLENLKSSLKTAYKLAAKANRKSHQNNKRLYDRKAKLRKFQVTDMVYLYHPARKPGLTKKFHLPWTGPFQITKKISDLNFEIADQNGKRQVVHVNRLKKAYSFDSWKSKQNQRPAKKPRKSPTKHLNEDTENEVQIRSFPLQRNAQVLEGFEPRTLPNQVPSTLKSVSPVANTPCSERLDPTYEPAPTPRSRRELGTTRPEPPLTRSRTRIQMQYSSVAEATEPLDQTQNLSPPADITADLATNS